MLLDPKGLHEALIDRALDRDVRYVRPGIRQLGSQIPRPPKKTASSRCVCYLMPYFRPGGLASGHPHDVNRVAVIPKGRLAAVGVFGLR
jgi:hypothetical protein